MSCSASAELIGTLVSTVGLGTESLLLLPLPLLVLAGLATDPNPDPTRTVTRPGTILRTGVVVLAVAAAGVVVTRVAAVTMA